MKNLKLKIGIVGYGFVGKAVDYGFETEYVEKFYVDPKLNTTIDDLVGFNPNLTFICLPTPMNGDLADINDSILKCLRLTKGAVVLKSTVTPECIESLCVTLAGIGVYKRFVYNPEFLTEANSIEQFIYPQFQIYGGESEACQSLAEIYDDYSNVTPAPVYMTTPIEASFAKYAINSFLAMKVTFFNQLYDGFQRYKHRGSFQKMLRAVTADPRIGLSHTKVPGYDKKRGFGGACLPKDTAAFVEEIPELTLLEEVIKVNNQYRKDYELDEREIEQNVDYGQTKEE